jgi:cytochrome P450
VGDLWAFIDDRLAFLEDCARSGDAVMRRMGPRRLLVVSHPDLVREVFVSEAKHFVRGVTAGPLRSTLGEGLLLSEGEVWRRQRRDLQPLFGAEWIAASAMSIRAAAEALVSRWSDGERRDIHREMHRLTLDIAARLFLGVESDDRGRLHPALEATLEHHVFPSTFPIRSSGWPLRPRATTSELDALVFTQIEERSRCEGTFMNALASTAYDRRELRDQIVTLMFTAQDTTAVALTWVWHLVSQNARVDAALRQELSGGTARVAERDRYVASVLSESLRLFPPVIGQAREAVNSCEIGGVPLRRGDLVAFSQWVIQRDGRWFDRPDAFLPERWRDGAEERLHPFAYFPFGGGRRVCVGRHLALAVGATVVPIIARRYRLLAVAGERPEIHAIISPRPRRGLPMELRRAA